MNNEIKQQEIKNMTRFIPATFNGKKKFLTDNQRRLIAEKLVAENYCQIPQGALWVTSGTELAQSIIFLGQAPSYLQLEADLKDQMRKEEYEKAKKVVAQEVLQDMYDKCFELVDPYDEHCTECKGSVKTDDILSLAEYYGVEIENETR